MDACEGRVDGKDLSDGLKFYSWIFSIQPPITKKDVRLLEIKSMEPEDYLLGRIAEEKGWLNKYKEKDRGKLMMKKYGRKFTRIIKQYDNMAISPLISIDGYPSDGIGRATYLHAIGEKADVAFYSRTDLNGK